MQKKIGIFSLFSFLWAILAYLYFTVLSGGTLLGLFMYALAFIICILCCGCAFSRLLFKSIEGWQALPVSFCLGVFFLYCSFIIFDFINCKSFFLLPAWLVGFVFVYQNRHKLAFKKELALPHSILLITATGFIFVYIFCALLPFARADKVGNFYVHQDMLWSVGNAASVNLGFPLTDMRFAGTTLNYHYLNDVTAGLLALGTGQHAYESLCFFYYPLVALALIVSLYQVAKKFTDNKILASCIPFIVLFCSGQNGVFHYITNINGQGGATLVLCAGVILLTADHEKIKPSKVLAAIAIGFVISMFKSTIGMLFTLAVTAACIVGFINKKTKPWHIMLCLSLWVGFAVAFFFIFSNAVNNLVFVGLAGLASLPLQVFQAAILGSILYVFSFFYSLKHYKELSFVQLTANAMFLGGAVAFLVYYHYSASQIYFILIAVPMLWLAVCPFLGQLLKRKNWLMPLFMVLVLANGLYASATILPSARSGVQALLRIYHLRQSDYAEQNVTADDYHAMLWLNENTQTDIVFATNRNNKQFEAGEGVFHYYSAVSERQCYLESYRYCMDYSGQYWEVRRRLEQVSDNIFYVWDEKTAFAAAKTEGIDYLVVFKPISHLAWQAAPAYENDTVAIFKV